MKLEGSCQCGKVRFSVESDTPYPFMYCFCSICRKTSGGAFGCNVMGKRESLRVVGARHLRSYHARIRERGRRAVISHAERWFCGECGTHLYLLDRRWPEGVWPNAGAVDTPLPVPPEQVFMMLEHKPAWAPVAGKGPRFSRYPELSIADWHESHGLTGGPGRATGGRRRRRPRATT